MLIAHLTHHDQPVSEQKVLEEFGWNSQFLRQAREKALRAGWLEVSGQGLSPTKGGFTISQSPRPE